jgi:hypothetical protein
MKNIFMIVLACAMVVSAYAKNGTEGNSTSDVAVMKNGSIFKLFYKAQKSGNVKISILDAKGKSLYSETLRNVESFVRPYNFSELSSGDYSIVLVDESGKQIRNVTYGTSKTQSSAKLFLKNMKSSNSYILRMNNKDSDVISVRILSSDNQLLYSETNTTDGDFSKIYRMEKFSGAVKFEVTDKTGTITILQ